MLQNYTQLSPLLAAASLASLLASSCTAPTIRRDITRHAPPLRAVEVRTEPTAADDVPADSLEAWVALALRSSPRVTAARERWQAMRERIDGADAWPDPVLRARYFAEEVQTRVGPQEYSLGFSQTIPWSSRSAAATDAAVRHAAAEHARTFAVAADVAEKVQLTWFELYYTDRALEIVNDNRDLRARLDEVVRTQYASGTATHADYMRSQVELDRSTDRRNSLEDRRQPLAARWRSAIHAPTMAAVPHPTTLGNTSPLESDEVLRRRAFEFNPELGALRSALAAAEGEVALADVSNRPNVTIGLDVIATDELSTTGLSGNGDDPIILSVSLPLPLRSKSVSSRRRASRASARAARAELAAQEDRLEEALAEQFYRIRDAERRVELYISGLLPKSAQTLEATETGFRAGSATFLELVDAQRAQLEFQLTLARATTDRAIAIAKLERLVGAPVHTGTGDNGGTQ